MKNPILQNLNRNQNQSNIFQRLNGAMDLIKGKNSEVLFKELMQSNPQFRRFANDIKGKSIEEIAMEYDLDIDLLSQFMN